MTTNSGHTKVWLRAYPSGMPRELTPPEVTGLDLFLERARANPDAPAIHYFDRTLSHGELDSLSSAFARGLLRRGFAPGDRLGLYLQNVPQFLICLLGAWKAGGIGVPLNPMLKERELVHHLRDSGARALVCLESLHATAAAACAQTGCTTVVTTSELEFLNPERLPATLAAARRLRCEGAVELMELVSESSAVALQVAPPRPEDVALMPYTSGTTGHPKGTLTTHRNFAFNAHVYREWMALDERDVIVGLAPLFHITGLVGHLGAALCSGAPLVLFHRFDAGQALTAIEQWKGTFTVAAITAFTALLEHPEFGRRDVSSLKKIWSGGAPLSAGIIQRYRAATGVTLHNIYGLTETTSPSHAVPMGMEAPVDPETGVVSVGVPVFNAECRVIDPQTGQDCPPGTAGELLTRGPMVVSGYWKKPDESAQAIRDGWLHTGDIAKMDERGWFYIVDRSKDMIIASGFKVWPREVEEVLYQHPVIREACVVGAPDDYRGETVVAYVSLREGASAVQPDELIDFCKARLAAYKYPRRVQVLDDLPKTATGKILRRELRARSQSLTP